MGPGIFDYYWNIAYLCGMSEKITSIVRVLIICTCLLTCIQVLDSHANQLMRTEEATVRPVYDLAFEGDLVLGDSTLEVNSAFILEFGSNNFSDQHYEYFVTLSDGIYNGGSEFLGATYTISIELLSIGAEFNYGDFESCFFCDNSTAFSYVGHLFLVEDTNDDDILDFNVDPFTNGESGNVKITKDDDLTSIEIDFMMDDGKILKGCHVGDFPIDPTISSLEGPVEAANRRSIRISHNPVEGLLSFHVIGNTSEGLYLKIVNTSGQVLRTFYSASSQPEIDLSVLPRGAYFLQVLIADGTRLSEKFILN